MTEAAARAAADALRATLDAGGKARPDGTMYLDGQGFWLQERTYKGLPGFKRVDTGPRGFGRGRGSRTAFTHALLPGWEYDRGELREMLDDLEKLAAGEGPPTEATRA